MRGALVGRGAACLQRTRPLLGPAPSKPHCSLPTPVAPCTQTRLAPAPPGRPPVPSSDVDEEEKGETPWAQQEAYEAAQIKKAAAAYGAKDRKPKAGGWVAAGGRARSRV